MIYVKSFLGHLSHCCVSSVRLSIFFSKATMSIFTKLSMYDLEGKETRNYNLKILPSHIPKGINYVIN